MKVVLISFLFISLNVFPCVSIMVTPNNFQKQKLYCFGQKMNDLNDLESSDKATIQKTTKEENFFVNTAKLVQKISVAGVLSVALTLGNGLPIESGSNHFVRVASAKVAPLADVGLREFLVKDGNEFLRLTLPTSLPISADPEKLGDTGRAVQQSVELVRLRLEQVGFSGKTPIWNDSAKDAKSAKALLVSPGMTKNIPEANMREAKELVEKAKATLDQLVQACRAQDIKSTLKLQEEASSIVYDIRLLSMEPGRLPYSIPSEYANLPQLRGRATVECTLQKQKGVFFMEDGTKSNEIKLTMIVDGYNAPLTSGNFIDLAMRKHYDGMSIQNVEDLIVQTGKPKQKRVIPLELFYKKDLAPVYEYTSDDDMRATEGFNLPFQAYGALGMEHDDEDPNTASTEFWFLKWDQGLIAPGRNTLDGSHACFGYVVQNQNLLSQAERSDKIVSMKVLQGAENLFLNGKRVS